MKTKSVKAATITILGIMALAMGVVSSCKEDNKITLFTKSSNTGTDVIDATIGGYPPPTYTTAGAWKVDKTHSNIMWETKYYGTGAPLTGRFNTFEMKVYFDEANPSNTTIYAWVVLSTFNTGETGRDAYGKCGPGYMGIKWDTVSAGPPVVLKPQAATDTAWFVSKSCVKYGNGYLVKGDFTFRGITKTIEMPMSYTGKSTTTNATTLKKTDRAGLIGKFGINALTEFGIVSNSIADLVTIRVDCNMVTNAY
jgi:polyisoprenoid-binding protein YceI